MKQLLEKLAIGVVLAAVMLNANSFASPVESRGAAALEPVVISSGAYLVEINRNPRMKLGTLMAQSQSFGSRCVTPVGSCTIQSQPVGSPCRCGQVQGTTLQ